MKSLFALLSYRAFKPHPLGTEEPLATRFKKRRLGGDNRVLVVSVGKTYWRAAIATYDAAGFATFSEPINSPLASNADAMVEWLADYANSNRIKYVALGIGHGYIVSVEHGLTRYPDVETQRYLRNDPSRIFGEKVASESGIINSAINHPHHENSSLRFKIQSEEINKVREICLHAGLAIVRMVCEQAQLLDLAYTGGFSPDANTTGLLVTLPSSYLHVSFDTSGWHSISFDPALDDQAVGSLIQSLSEVVPQGANIAFIDAGMPGMEDVLLGLSSHAPKRLFENANLASFAAITLH